MKTNVPRIVCPVCGCPCYDGARITMSMFIQGRKLQKKGLGFAQSHANLWSAPMSGSPLSTE